MRGQGDDDDDYESNNNLSASKGIRVVLKILDQSHKDIALVSRVIFLLMITNLVKRITVVVYQIQIHSNKTNLISSRLVHALSIIPPLSFLGIF